MRPVVSSCMNFSQGAELKIKMTRFNVYKVPYARHTYLDQVFMKRNGHVFGLANHLTHSDLLHDIFKIYFVIADEMISLLYTVQLTLKVK